MTRDPPLRWLIVLACASELVAVVIDQLRQEASFPTEVEMAMYREVMVPWLALGNVAYRAILVVVAALVVGNLLGAIGMFFFRRWGRWLSLWATAALLLVGAAMFAWGLHGVKDLTGMDVVFHQIAVLAWGAALAVAYWSPVASRFEKRPSPDIVYSSPP